MNWPAELFEHSVHPATAEDEARLSYLNECLEQPWFRRAWVLQEVIYGRRVTVHCGNVSVDWNHFASIVVASYRNGAIVELLSEESQQSAKTVVQIGRSRHLTRSKRSLLSVLLDTNSTQCSDPRDKVYAVLSLANEAISFSTFQPDYTLTAAEVYETCAALLIEAMGKVDVLCCSTDVGQIGSVDSAQLPSWAPDWSRIENGLLFTSHDQIPFDCGGRGHTIPIKLEAKVLSFPATRVDTIRTVIGPSKFAKTPIFKPPSYLDDWTGLEQTAQWVKLCCDTAEATSLDNSKDFWRPMLCDLTGEGQRAPPRFERHFTNYKCFLEQSSLLVWRLHHKHSVPVDMRFFNDEMNGLMRRFHADIAAVESSLFAWSSKRQFAITEAGRLAFVPNSATPGDAIFVVDGLPVPLILRPIGSEYRSIGEAYVHGIMYTEEQQTETGHLRETVKVR
jgi:hypothetical protein